MFDRSSQVRHKTALGVRVALAGQEPFEGFVFVKVDERLSDLLNDARAFIPVRRADGSTSIIAKSTIASITETGLAGVPQQDDPVVLKPEDVLKGGDTDDVAAEVESDRPPPSDPDPGTEPAAEATKDGADPHAGPSEGRGDAPPRQPRPRRVLDPYALLRVPRGSSLEDVKRAYYQRIKAVHPDTLASLGLDDDVVKAAHMTAQRINQAYERVLRDYQRPADSEQSGADLVDPQNAA